MAAVIAGLEAGMSVVGIDAHEVASGAAGRNGGFLLAGPAHFHHRARARFGTDAAAALYSATVREIERFVSAGDSVRRCGSLRVPVDDAEIEDIEQHRSALVEDHFAAKRYSGSEGVGLLVPGDGTFDPVAWIGALSRRAADGGALLFERTPAIEVGPGRVTTPQGEVACEHIIVAVDGGLEVLLPELAQRVRTWRLQMLSTLPVARRVTEHAVYHRYGLDYWQQLPDGRIALGGGRDIGGEAEAGIVGDTSVAVQGFLDRLLLDRLGVSARVERRWSATVAYTDDRLPICEETRPGVFAIGAYSGTGNVIGSICGREAVARVSGKAAPFVELLESIRAERGLWQSP